ncbi:organic cation transporter protein-like [Tachypleus tridentatus]|uniref:organic cation transporter protein-like n=1 Tax=Tachypleus tridentatus TaxID=6853 RepID=UPI003FD0DF89
MYSEKQTKNDEMEDVKEITDVIGGYGPWQRRLFIIFVLASFVPAWHNLVIAFFAPNIDYWCSRPSSFSNLTVEQWKNKSIPIEKKNGEIFYSHCERYDNYDRIETNLTTTKCDTWEYDKSFYEATIIDEWDLVCDDEWMVSLTQSLYMAGFLVATIMFGQLADRFGRRPIILICVVIVVTSGLGTAFSSSFAMFTALRFLVALGSAGLLTTGFVVLVEVVGPKHRTIFGIAIQFGWAAGYTILPGIAWLLPNWSHIQMAISIPCIGFFSLWWILPESPRWLLTHNKFNEAEKELVKVMFVNKKDMSHLHNALKILKAKAEKEEELEKRSHVTVIDLLRYPNMRKKTINIYLSWFVISFTYYALSLSTNDLGGSPFINFVISGAVEFPAYAVSVFAINNLGRRKCMVSTMVVGGLACILTIPIPDSLLWLRIMFAMCGKFFVTAAFAIVYVYTAELFPTVVRNVGVGSSSMFARIGSMVAPFLKELGKFTNTGVPLAIYGALSIIAGLLTLLLPETTNRAIPDTLEQGEKFTRESNNGVENIV